VIIMMMTAADRHPIAIILETKDAAIVAAAMGEIIIEGNGEVEAAATILGPCREAAAALSLTHVI
jgi:hypothetical protein